MKRQLMTLLMALAVAGGCARNKSGKVPDVAALPPGSYSKAWTANLNLGKETSDRLFIREDMVFLYTQSHTAYAMSRSGAQLLFINPIDVSGGILRPPVVLPQAMS